MYGYIIDRLNPFFIRSMFPTEELEIIENPKGSQSLFHKVNVSNFTVYQDGEREVSQSLFHKVNVSNLEHGRPVMFVVSIPFS